MKTLSSEIIEMEGESRTAMLYMASGDVRNVKVSSLLHYDFFVDYRNRDRNKEINPYKVLTPKYRLEEMIRDGVVKNGINYGLVESYKLIRPEPFTHKVEKIKQKGFLVTIGFEPKVFYKEVE